MIMSTTSAETAARQRPVRLGYVGCGFIAQHIHLPNFASLPECDFLALAEVRPQLGRAVAEHYRIPRLYSSHLELAADPDIEAVAVSADYALQGAIAADLLRAGKDVFMEKPMAVSVKQAETILAAEHEGGGRLMVGYMKRFDPTNILMRQTVRDWRASGDKGRLLYLRAHGFCGNWTAGRDRTTIISSDEPMPPVPRDGLLPEWLPPEYASKYIGYLQQYTHNINLAMFMLDVTDPAAMVVKAVELDRDGLTGVVILELGGVRVTVESAQTKFHAWEEHTQVYFEGGWVHAWSPMLFANPGNPRIEIYEGGDTPSYRTPIAQPIAAWHFREEARHFLEAVRDRTPFGSPGEIALNDATILEDIYRHYIAA
ncbi:Predicted dehydrogenase [Kaistia soli DSM 19436]|uniref:Predicted dehydrogenase n=2 Tax=Kaistia TaxID=166953 RepID=A0A1M5PFA0_9HYPH|nr:Predicted dehydrogenase [Kaistia soli DSM 19436]